MTGVKDNALTRLRGWPTGLDNLSAEAQVPIGDRAAPGTGQPIGALRVAENVDIDDAGRVSSRAGYTALQSLPGLHSLYAHPHFPWMLGVYDGELVGFDSDLQMTSFGALEAPRERMSFDFDAGAAYFTNGFDSGRVRTDGVRQPWALPAPTGQPIVSAYAGAGGLAAGWYQVAITYLDDDGRESGATLAVEVELAAGQGILLTAIPQPLGSPATWIRIYTGCKELRYATEVPVGTTQYLLGVHTPGALLETQFQEPLPAGQIVRLYRGRMYVFRNNVLFWSEAQHYGQGVLHANYLSFNAAGTLLEGVKIEDAVGLYLAAGHRTYFMTGSEPKDWQRAISHPHGAVPGSALQVDASILGLELTGTVPYWLDADGQFVVGTPGGRVQTLHDRSYAGRRGVEEAAAAIREHNGQRQVITTFRGGTPSPLGVTDRVEAEVWKDGVRIS